MPQTDKCRTVEQEERFLRFRQARAAIRKRDAAGLIWCLLDLYMEDLAQGCKSDVTQKTFDKCLDVVGSGARRGIGGAEDLPGADTVAAWLGENAN